MQRPEKEGDLVYTNFDHSFELTPEQVRESGRCHQHAAWDFCGYIYYDKETNEFVEEVWVYRNLVNTLRSKSLEELIEEANDRYGRY